MPTAFQDYYGILGVPRTATQKEIKAAFRKLARKHHPDVNQNDPAAEARFKEVNEANEVLSDPEKRRRYDELGPRWREYEAWERAGKPGSPPFGGSGSPGGPPGEYRTVSPDDLEAMFGDADPFSDFFHSMFGGTGTTTRGRTRSRRAAPARRGDDVEGAAEITLEEAYTGTSRTVELSNASRSTRRVEVKVPPGVADGARVRAAGQGGAGSSGASAGDLLIQVRIRPHPRFTREGDDLKTVVSVPLDVALLGGEVPVSTLRGTTAQLKVAPASQNGARLRLRGLGMPKLRGGGHGDLIVEVSVRLPARVTPEVSRLAEALRAERES